MIVLSRRPIPATTGNFAAARAPTRGSTTWPPCVWPDSTSGTPSAAASVNRRGSCASRNVIGAASRVRAAMSIWRLVQKRMPTRSIVSLRIRNRVRARQSDDTDSGARHFKLMALVEKPVPTAAGDDADAAGEGAFEDGAASHRHRLL